MKFVGSALLALLFVSVPYVQTFSLNSVSVRLPSVLQPSHTPYSRHVSPKFAQFSLTPSLRSSPNAANGCVSLRASSNEGVSRLVDLPGRRYIFVGGKGGVGKTSTSSAIALKFADEGLRTLVISTDPAHSLGDALMTDLSGGKVTAVSEQGGNLYALEVDLEEAVEEFKRVVQGLKGNEDADSLAGKLGLSEMTDIFDVAPPGADELVALSKVMSLVEEGEAKTALGESIQFDRIVIDTAPTGHTIRLLEYPRFISDLITKSLSLRSKIDLPFDMVNQAGSFIASQLGIKMPSKDSIKQGGAKANEVAIKFRDRMELFDSLLHDPDRSEFVIVCIATGLSSAESGRLATKLLDSNVALRHIVVNQLLRSETESEAYLHRITKDQDRTLKYLQSSPQVSPLHMTKVPLFDTEIVGVYGLRALGAAAFGPDHIANGQYGKLFDTDTAKDVQFVFVGGKGGVGKTSTSSALGVKLADDGVKTLLISTDPAHSLGDCLSMKLSGSPAMVEGTDGNLFAMEVDTEKALEEFKEKLRGVSSMKSKLGELASKIGLDEFADLLENPPPGIDEVVALGNVLDIAKKGDFQRIVVDTAPTGHTLRLLSFPDFLDSFLQKVITIKKKLDGAINAAKTLFGIANFASGEAGKDDIEDAVAALERTRAKAVELKQLLRDTERTQFVVVSIATALAAAESERLVKGLKKRGVACENIIINRLLTDAQATDKFLQRVVKAQDASLKDINRISTEVPLNAKGDPPPVRVQEVPFFDTELRNVYALRVLSNVLFKPQTRKDGH